LQHDLLKYAFSNIWQPQLPLLDAASDDDDECV
jgi:hypothetical protein